MAVTTRQSFFEILFVSNLLTAEQFSAATAGETEESPRVIAKRLVKQGWLTLWQAQQLLAGRSQFFLGKYKLLDALGQGGMGSVFTAEHTAMRRVVALKVMSKALLKDSGAIARFQREIRSAAALNHPNIVAAYDADCVKDTYFLVMEYVPGDTLKSWVKARGALPIEWSCECIWQVAVGLQHAYERNMVHRDIKSSNLLVVKDEATGAPVVKILDMGLARFASETHGGGGELTQTGQIMGSPDYIAPEQAKSAKDADIRADIFSLGCTLYELLTGQVPYTGQNVMEKLMARAVAPAPRVSSVRFDVSPALDDVVAKMLERDPDRRFQTPGEVAAALLPIKHGTPSMPSGVLAAGRQLDVSGGSSIKAQADETLNGFLENLASRVTEEPPFTAAAASRRKRTNWVALGGIGVAILAAAAAFSFLGKSGGEKSKAGKTKSRQSSSLQVERSASEMV